MNTDEEPIEAWEPEWDDVVDVICAGAGLGALAHAICCADLDLDVELADAEFSSATMDPETAAYLQSMTDDLDAVDGNPELAVVRAQPVTVGVDRRATIEPFFGSRLRDWSARCAASPFGVVYSQIPDVLTTMRTDAGETIRAAVLGDYRPVTARPGWEVAEWLRRQARDRGIPAQPGTVLQRLVFVAGRVTGAALSTREGTRLVRATAGVALSLGPILDSADWPEQPELSDGAAQIAVVSRTASRFGRVELLYSS